MFGWKKAALVLATAAAAVTVTAGTASAATAGNGYNPDPHPTVTQTVNHTPPPVYGNPKGDPGKGDPNGNGNCDTKPGISTFSFTQNKGPVCTTGCDTSLNSFFQSSPFGPGKGSLPNCKPTGKPSPRPVCKTTSSWGWQTVNGKRCWVETSKCTVPPKFPACKVTEVTISDSRTGILTTHNTVKNNEALVGPSGSSAVHTVHNVHTFNNTTDTLSLTNALPASDHGKTLHFVTVCSHKPLNV
jgi:hypothetical protein